MGYFHRAGLILLAGGLSACTYGAAQRRGVGWLPVAVVGPGYITWCYYLGWPWLMLCAPLAWIAGRVLAHRAERVRAAATDARGPA